MDLGVTGEFLIIMLDDQNLNTATSIFTGSSYPEGGVQTNGTADAVVISDSITLGGGRNSSKFCLVDGQSNHGFYAVLSVLVLILLAGAVSRSKTV